jgi:hypothetical protein
MTVLEGCMKLRFFVCICDVLSINGQFITHTHTHTPPHTHTHTYTHIYIYIYMRARWYQKPKFPSKRNVPRVCCQRIHVVWDVISSCHSWDKPRQKREKVKTVFWFSFLVARYIRLFEIKLFQPMIFMYYPVEVKRKHWQIPPEMCLTSSLMSDVYIFCP